LAVTVRRKAAVLEGRSRITRKQEGNFYHCATYKGPGEKKIQYAHTLRVPSKSRKESRTASSFYWPGSRYEDFKRVTKRGDELNWKGPWG